MSRGIVLFGFSGSGKSTMANLIAKKYSLRVIHPSGILRDLYEGKKINLKNTKYNTGFWETKKGVELFKSRLKEKEPLDVVSDKILVEEIEKGDVVIDSWSLPWLSSEGVKIYIKADLNVRARRVSVRSGIDYNEALEVVSMKDEETRKLFYRLYGFDIKMDHDIFDYIIDSNSKSIDEVFELICNFINEFS